jgi:rod shape-determining protein MreB
MVKDFELAEQLIRPLLREVTGRALRRPSVLVAFTKGLAEASQRALLDCVRASGAGRVCLVESTLAAAVGAELPVFDPVANLIADVGGGRTKAALFSLGGPVVARSVELGGSTLDSALAVWARTRHGVVLSAATAEQLKLAYARGTVLHVRGRDLRTGAPRDLQPEVSEVTDALAPVVGRIVAVLAELLRSSPPELCADLLDRGVILAGGVSDFELLVQAIRDGTGLPALPVPEPGECVARGLARLLGDADLFHRATM